MFNGNYHAGTNPKPTTALLVKSSRKLTRGNQAPSTKKSLTGRGEQTSQESFQTATEKLSLKEPKAGLDESAALPGDADFGGVFDVLKVGSVPLLTLDEEAELAERIKAGDEAARERMIRANLRLVIKIARDYEHMGLPMDDLISEGIIGLMKAVEKFNPAKGSKLSSYGSLWIKQQIRRAISNQGRTIRLPVHVEGKLYRLGRAEARLRNVLGRDATDEELAGEISISTKKVARLRQSSLRPVSLDSPVGEDQDSTVAELVADDTALSPASELQKRTDLHLLKVLLHQLPERHASILRCRFGLDGGEEQTLEEVGDKFGLTRERIRQLQNEAFRMLREMMEQPQPLDTAA